MSDARIRELERRAAAGDAEARLQLAQVLRRTGQARALALEAFDRDAVGASSTLFSTRDVGTLAHARLIAAERSPANRGRALELTGEPERDLPLSVSHDQAWGVSADALREELETGKGSLSHRALAALRLRHLDPPSGEAYLAELLEAAPPELQAELIDSVRTSSTGAEGRLEVGPRLGAVVAPLLLGDPEQRLAALACLLCASTRVACVEDALRELLGRGGPSWGLVWTAAAKNEVDPELPVKIAEHLRASQDADEVREAANVLLSLAEQEGGLSAASAREVVAWAAEAPPALGDPFQEEYLVEGIFAVATKHDLPGAEALARTCLRPPAEGPGTHSSLLPLTAFELLLERADDRTAFLAEMLSHPELGGFAAWHCGRGRDAEPRLLAGLRALVERPERLWHGRFGLVALARLEGEVDAEARAALEARFEDASLGSFEDYHLAESAEQELAWLEQGSTPEQVVGQLAAVGLCSPKALGVGRGWRRYQAAARIREELEAQGALVDLPSIYPTDDDFHELVGRVQQAWGSVLQPEAVAEGWVYELQGLPRPDYDDESCWSEDDDPEDLEDPEERAALEAFLQVEPLLRYGLQFIHKGTLLRLVGAEHESSFSDWPDRSALVDLLNRALLVSSSELMVREVPGLGGYACCPVEAHELLEQLFG